MKREADLDAPVSYADESDSENLRLLGELADEIFEAGLRAAEHLRRAAELMGPPSRSPWR